MSAALFPSLWFSSFVLVRMKKNNVTLNHKLFARIISSCYHGGRGRRRHRGRRRGRCHRFRKPCLRNLISTKVFKNR